MVTERLVALFGTMAGAERGEGAFAPGPALWVGRREVAHIDGDGALDIRLTRREISARRAALRVTPGVVLKAGSDWLELDLAVADEGLARHLLLAAVAANMASAPPGGLPMGADLERRRRFH